MDNMHTEIIFTGPAEAAPIREEVLFPSDGSDPVKKEKRLKPGEPITIPILDAAALVQTYPEQYRFADEASALEKIAAFVIEQKRREQEGATLVALEAAKNKPQTEDPSTLLLRREAVAKALKGEI